MGMDMRVLYSKKSFTICGCGPKSYRFSTVVFGLVNICMAALHSVTWSRVSLIVFRIHYNLACYFNTEQLNNN